MTEATTATVFARLLPPLRPEWRGIIGSYLIGTASTVALTAIAVLAALGVGHAVVSGDWPPTAWWVSLSALVLLRAILTWREMDVSHALAYRVLARLRVTLFDAYSRSVPGRRREHSGRAAAVVMTDIEKLEFFYAHTLAQIGASVTLFLLSLIGAAVIMPAAALVVLFGGAIVALTALLGAAPARRIGAQEQREREDQSEKLVDALGAMREILAYGLQDRIVREAVDGTRRAARTSRRRALIAEAVNGTRELILTAVVISIILLALVTSGPGGIGAQGGGVAALLPALVTLSVAGVAAIAEASHTVTELHPLAASARRVAAAISRPAVVADVADPIHLPQGPLGVRFDDVSFSYDDQTRALHRWSMEIAPREHVGLAGASGAGKSTVIALAARLWDPEHGTIALVDDAGRVYPLDAIAEEDLRTAVAVVEQDARLFHGTVRENLLRGASPRDDGALHAVLERVGADTWITLDDQIGEHGVRLSGGQRARLALARALVREPRVLIVDEITASLDPATERRISDVLAGFDGTVIAASHRRETLERLERVIRIAPDRVPATVIGER
ncbi:ABC transporter ATP-binding protein [Microbacterium sp. LWH12-1.2]|uniref:ABC transporter ATP-binding protein n=1 Tax=Microbacterium sp. LWH12-1.2 TaxID=3135259 RepID=UPI003433B78C